MKYTNEQIRGAILRAATRVETNMQCYDFYRTRVPDCETPGCLWGWIGFELGFKAKTRIGEVCEAMGMNENHLYSECHPLYNLGLVKGYDRAQCTVKAVEGMRKFADKYYPITAPKSNYWDSFAFDTQFVSQESDETA